ncbi:unnamed protein product, partial [marine sediment metagenome]
PEMLDSVKHPVMVNPYWNMILVARERKLIAILQRK